MRLHPISALALLAATACTPRFVVPDAERERTGAALDGQARYLRVAVTVHPLFGDTARRLVLAVPPGEADLLRGGNDELIQPPPAEAVLKPGTPVRIERVEFPTAFVIARRVVMSPRYHPWVVLSVAGDARPHVLALRQTAATAADVTAEVDGVLAADDPSPVFAALPADQREAVLKKELIDGMSARAVEMAWGLPERRRIDRPARTEEWGWPGGTRRAFFNDEKLVRWER